MAVSSVFSHTMIAIFAIFLLGLLLIVRMCAPFFLAKRAMKGFPPVNLLMDIRHRWGSKVTDLAASCVSAAARATYADMRRDSWEYQAAIMKENMVHGWHLGLVLLLGTVGSTVFT